MVFSSVPLYLDPPNWQQPNPNNGETQISQQLMEPGRPIRAAETTSMTERARQAKIPMPEGPLKCPRCDSQNTKFCYFNNYNLSQPRHFCKTCRRYWTRGGSLRNVPVGGGCRRNKRKRSSKRQKSPAPAAQAEPRPEPPPAPEQFMAPPPQFSFMASLQSLMTSQIGMGSYGGGFGSSSTMYPFHNNYNNTTAIGGGETVSYGKGLNLMEEMRGGGGELNLMRKQYNGTTTAEDDVVGVSHQQLLWNSSSNGGLWTDFSGIGSSSSTTPMNNVLR